MDLIWILHSLYRRVFAGTFIGTQSTVCRSIEQRDNRSLNSLSYSSITSFPSPPAPKPHRILFRQMPCQMPHREVTNIRGGLSMLQIYFTYIVRITKCLNVESVVRSSKSTPLTITNCPNWEYKFSWKLKIQLSPKVKLLEIWARILDMFTEAGMSRDFQSGFGERAERMNSIYKKIIWRCFSKVSGVFVPSLTVVPILHSFRIRTPYIFRLEPSRSLAESRTRI